ncbi:GEMI5-like protein [Mya arenaria]|uniref:GEMI5-like protein n=1 Tax=Mya arenaria TaxID=6604 RepID=A0ABY7DL04_MYAAR|nr:GEMI5-like protein [Mya arenaria]
MGREFRLVAVVQTHHKLVNVVAWHPHITMATPNNSPYKHYLAIASNESYISVVDLSSLFDESGPSSRLHVTDCWRKLEGHSHRVTGLDWSPHTDEHLVSVSYDGKALWSGLDPREVITGGDDFSAHIWSIDDHPLQPGQLGACQLDSGHLDSGQSTPRVVSVMGMTTEDSEDIEKLLERKRRELLAKGAVDQPGLNIKQNSKVTEDGDRSRSPEPVAREQPSVGRETQGQAFVVEPTSGTSKKGDKFDNRRKKKARSFFPELSLKENRGKQQMLDDLVTLATLIYGMY